MEYEMGKLEKRRLVIKNQAFEKMEKYKHTCINCVFLNSNSPLIVFCEKHDVVHETTFYKYTRAKTGLPCCGNALKSEKLAGRKFSPETIERMKVASNQRPSRGGAPRRDREKSPNRKWIRQIYANFNNTCAITGVPLQRTGKRGNLVAHHLYNLTAFPHLSVIPENGVLLTATLHTQFHKNYGYKNNTLPQFQEFLLFLIDSLQKSKNELMPISSQANLKKLEGSETRAYDRDKVMKLYKRLEEIDKFLVTIKTVT